MRIALIAGVLLAALGGFIVLKGISYTREESVLKLGEFEAKVKQKKAVPEWAGGIALGAGLVLIVVGLKQR